ncbi:MAG TPA: APC family permease [Streptosporangiaceae bacterium]|jgi:amino acid transporter|nr:APC family permease [Streptosporangiaceae bacterium]
MSEQAAASVAGTMPSPVARLEPDAIGVAQDTVIGMASSAPAATAGLSIAGLAAATAYGAGAVLILTAIPMLIIANAYRRLNLWNANCGATFEWVGRAINPYLGYLTGWLMVAAYIIGTVAEVLLLGPSVLAVFGSTANNTGAYIAIGAAVGIVMLIIAIVGIRITARTQVGIALIEYMILIGLAVAGLVYVFSHHLGTAAHPSSAWLNPNGVHGLGGSAVAGFLTAVFVYGGWDGTLYVNEEVKHRRVNPGRAAIFAVALLAVIYTLSQVGFQGVLTGKQLTQASNQGTFLVAAAQVLGGGFWAKAMALAIALSVIATTGTGIVLGARLVYGMASYRALPGFLSNVSRRWATPVYASIMVGVLIIVLSAVYFLATTVQNAFNDVIAVVGFMFSIFYIMTALAAIVYYRRRIFRGFWDFVTIGLLPLGAAGFLGWVLVKSILDAGAALNWSLVAIIAIGLVLMIIARFGFKSPFFQIRRESEAQES